MQVIKKLSSFFNTVRQAIFHFKPNGLGSRKAMGTPTLLKSGLRTPKAKPKISPPNLPSLSGVRQFIKNTKTEFRNSVFVIFIFVLLDNVEFLRCQPSKLIISFINIISKH